MEHPKKSRVTPSGNGGSAGQPRPAKSSLCGYVVQLDQYKHKLHYEYLESVCQLKGALSWPLCEYSKIVQT